MTILQRDTALTGELGRLHPYLDPALERAARFALHMHADEVTVEHLCASLLEDEECAATRLVQHAFADPETIAVEVTALTPGIMVVTAQRCMPFSVLGVRVLFAARAGAVRGEQGEVEIAHLVAAALEELPTEVRTALAEAGLGAESPVAELEKSATPVPVDGPLLKPFSQTARRSLSAAGRLAHQLGRDAISPAHLVLAGLETAPELAQRLGLTASRGRMALAGRDGDSTPPPARGLQPEPALRELIAALPAGGGTADVLGYLVHHGSEELRGLLGRQKITPKLLDHAADAFRDPDVP